jgi:hypothetical protein
VQLLGSFIRNQSIADTLILSSSSKADFSVNTLYHSLILSIVSILPPESQHDVSTSYAASFPPGSSSCGPVNRPNQYTSPGNRCRTISHVSCSAQPARFLDMAR